MAQGGNRAGPAAGEAAWRAAVRVVRAADTAGAMTGPGGSGRATLFDFAGTGGGPPDLAGRTWIGRVVQAAGSNTGPHHHGRHEAVIHVLQGHAEIRWGARLEYMAGIGPGDSVYFAPFVPYQERNLSAAMPVEYLVVRSDGERIVEALDIVPAAQPQAAG